MSDIPLEKAGVEYMEILINNGMAPKTEVVPVGKATGRMTGGPVYARLSSPGRNASAVDGIATDAGITAGADKNSPVILTPEQYIRVGSGDPLPEGCNAVIKTEDVTVSGDGFITIIKAAVPWREVRQVGEDMYAGQMIIPSYSLVTPSALGSMIAGGVTEIVVVKRPIAGIISTVCELDKSTSTRDYVGLQEVNAAIYSAMMQEWGAETIAYPAVPNEFGELSAALKKALPECDVVLINAGDPEGDKWRAADAIADNGCILYHGLAIKPGKSTILGYSGAKPVLGVARYPVSGIIAAEQIMRPIIEHLCHKTSEYRRNAEALLARAVVSAPEYREFVRVRLGYIKDNLIASPLSRGSGILTSFMNADGIIQIPQGSEGFKSGEYATVTILRPESQLRSNLLMIGSHDPLLDELAELLQVRYNDTSLISTHAGSMTGLLAVRRGEAHLAGVHLFDDKTGRFNVPFIQRLLPDGRVRLVECVKRTLGLMVPKGNPKKILSIRDLTRQGVRYINRHTGSGTRILLDHIFRERNVDTKSVSGYDRGEYTYNAVASFISAGEADAGPGILSVAKAYGLDFVPVYQEQYDLLIPHHVWSSPMIKKLLEVLSSTEFRQRADSMGGYIVDKPGNVRKMF